MADFPLVEVGPLAEERGKYEKEFNAGHHVGCDRADGLQGRVVAGLPKVEQPGTIDLEEEIGREWVQSSPALCGA